MKNIKQCHDIKLLQITDSHLFEQAGGLLLGVNTRDSLNAVIQHIRETHQNIDIVLATGDISHDGSAQSYQYFLSSVKPLAPLVRGLPGNHDLPAILSQEWQQHATPITDIAGWRIVALDTTIPNSNAGALAATQLDLLENACESAPDQHVLLALHHNPVASGCAWLDTMMVDNHHQLFQRIERLPNIQAMIWGHIHQAFDKTHRFDQARQLRMLATPATSIQFMPQRETFALDTRAPGYRILTLTGDGSIRTQVYRVAGINIQPDSASTGY